MHRIELRQLILLLVIATALMTCATSFYASYQTLREQLVSEALEDNQAYAAKLARSADTLFKSVQMQLAYSASTLSNALDQPERVEAEAERLKLQTDTFNATYVVRADGRILAGMPRHYGLVGTLLESEGAQAALKERRPMISAPYVSSRGNLVIFISHPIFDKDGDYQGYVGGPIYLAEPNILHTLLGQHYHQDGSYLYVVDRNRRLIYHQDIDRVGEIVTGNAIIEAVIAGGEGPRAVTNSLGVDMLAGYAPVDSTGWGIVSQQPTEATLQALDGLMRDILIRAIPFGFPTLLAIWFLSKLIVRPLRQLAITAQHWEHATSREQIRQVRAWYFEAEQLKHAMLGGLSLLHRKLGKLNQESITDPLTGLTNRRGQRFVLEQWQAQDRPFAVIALDIDHFKQVNDTYGHEAGDQVLQFASRLMRSVSRSSDLLCRVGGEEFLILLPDTRLEAAALVAERLRKSFSLAESPTGSVVTISAGVAYWPGGEASLSAALKRADQALYQAKREGRNRIVTSRQQDPAIAG